MSHAESKFPLPLRMLFWESTARCNLSCSHCRRLDLTKAQDELTTAQAKSLIDSASKMGPPVFVFSGGEPLMRDDWEELADYAKSQAVPTALATNGTLIDHAMAGRIAAAGFSRVAVSIDSPDPEIHDRLRGHVGAFEAAMAGLDALASTGVATQLNVTVVKRNVDHLNELYELAHKIRAVAMHLFLLVPVGCGLELAETQQISPAKYEEVLNWICDRREAFNKASVTTPTVEVRATCGPHYYRVAAQRGMAPERRAGRGCLAGLSVIFVSHRGEVFPCGYLPVKCGSICDEPLEDIWLNSEVLLNLRDFDKLTGKCGRCDFKNICGGCRARALGQTGDYLAEEPFCTYDPKKNQTDRRENSSSRIFRA